MATRLVHLLIDSADPLGAATFWARALGWEPVDEGPDEAVAQPVGFDYPGVSAVPLVFVSVTEPKTVKNRVHLDLTSTSQADQAAKVERLLGLGATHIDIGQGEVPWVALADPEGNEFCVLEPRPVYRDAGPVAAIVVDCVDPEAMSRFWAVAAGWPVTGSDKDLIALRSASGEGPFLELLRSAEPKQVKNRVHLDTAPFTDDDQAADVARLQAAGAELANVGQSGTEGWIVMSDPDGQEFCVLTPR
jgi:predicted enzyme related to lactoylglutathione lyase